MADGKRCYGFFMIMLSGLFFFLSCSTLSVREDLSKSFLCYGENIEDVYFSNYEKAAECSIAFFNKSRRSSSLKQTAGFIAGESYFMEGDDRKAFEYLSEAAKGPSCNTALAAVAIIRELDLTYRELEKAAALNTSEITDSICRSLIDSERKSRHIINGNFRSARKIDGDLNFLKDIKIFAESIPGRESLSVKVILPGTLDTLYLDDFIDNPERFPVRVEYRFSFDEEKTAPLMVRTDSPYRLFINGQNINGRSEVAPGGGYVDTAGEFKFSKGDYTVTFELPDQRSSGSFLSVFMPHYSKKQPFYSKERLGEKGVFAYVENPIEEKPHIFQSYLGLYLATMLNRPANDGNFLEIYSSVLGSRNSAFLYRGAVVSLISGNFVRAESIFDFIVTENRNATRAWLSLMKILLDSGRFYELDEMLSDVPEHVKKTLSLRLFTSDYLSSRGFYPESLKVSLETFHDFRDYPVAAIYYSAALEEFGALHSSVREKRDIINFLPYLVTVLENGIEVAGETGLLEDEIFFLQKLLDINPFNRKVASLLGKTYMKSLMFEKASGVFLEILKNVPEDINSLLALGDMAVLRNDKKGAAGYYGKAYSYAPDNIEVSEKASFYSDTGFASFFKDLSATDDEVYERVRKNVSLMPDKPYEVVFDEGLQKIVNSKIMKGYYRLAIKLNNMEGIRLFSEIGKDGSVVQARIIKKDGSISKNVKESFNTLLFYDIEPGDTVDYTYTLTQESGSWLDAFNSVWHFGQFGVLNRYSRVKVYVPDEMKIHFFVHGDVEKVSPVEKEGGRVYEFRTENIYLPPKEKMMPADILSIVPNMQMSAVSSWEDVSVWQSLFIREGSVVTTDMERAVSSLIKKEQDNDGIVRVLRDFVAREISYTFADSGIGLVKPERSDVTFARKSGDCKDKALLLKTLLKIAGIKSNYVLVKSRLAGELRIEIPYMQFDHAMLFIPQQYGIPEGFFVDPTAGYDHFRSISSEIEGTVAMIINENEGSYEFVKVSSGIVSGFSLKSTGDRSFELLLKGGSASLLRFRLQAGETFENLVAEVLISIGSNASPQNIEMIGSPMDEPLKVVFFSDSFIPSVVTKNYAPLVAISERNYPVQLSAAVRSYSFLITAPVPKKVDGLKIDNKFFSYIAHITDDGTIKVDFILKKERIRAEEFAELKKSIIRIMEFEKKLLSEIEW